MLKMGVDDWRVALTPRSVLTGVAEILVCACCPVPFTPHVCDFVLSLPMFLRFLLLGRFLLLHNAIFTDTTARSVAALNRLKYDYRFIVKSVMSVYPGTCLLVFGTLYCTISSYVMMLCER